MMIRHFNYDASALRNAETCTLAQMDHIRSAINAEALRDPKTLTKAELNDLRRRSQPFITYEEMERLWQRRKALTRASTERRCGNDKEAKKNLLTQALNSLLDVKHIEPNDFFEGSGRGLIVLTTKNPNQKLLRSLWVVPRLQHRGTGLERSTTTTNTSSYYLSSGRMTSEK